MDDLRQDLFPHCPRTPPVSGEIRSVATPRYPYRPKKAAISHDFPPSGGIALWHRLGEIHAFGNTRLDDLLLRHSRPKRRRSTCPGDIHPLNSEAHLVFFSEAS